MPDIVLTHTLIVAAAQCFYGPDRPTACVIDRYFSVLDVPPAVGAGATNKRKRMEELLWWVRNNCPSRAPEILELIVSDLHHGGHLNANSAEAYVGDQMAGWLHTQLAKQGFRITPTGELVAVGALTAETLPAGREHVRVQVERLMRSREDAAALLGHAKDLLETVAKTVLQETGARGRFTGLWAAAERGPGRATADSELGGPRLERGCGAHPVHNGLWTMANSVNLLRNPVGTGHGRLVSAQFEASVARAVVDGAVSLARLWLELLDAREPNSRS
jgi:hypothetical protein